MILSLYVSSLVGFLNAFMLWRPPAGGALFTEFMRQFDATGTYANIDGVIFIAYQVLGAGSYLVVALFSIAFTVAIMTAINLKIRTPGAWLWRALHRVSAFTWTWKSIPFVAAFALFSIASSGGWLYGWLTQLAGWTLS